jgi:hypothetical protein
MNRQRIKPTYHTPALGNNYRWKLSVIVGLVILSLLSIFMLSGCSTKKNVNVYLYKPVAAPVMTREDILHQMKKIGLPVMQKDNAVVIVLNNEKVFKKQAVQLKPRVDYLLYALVLLMREDKKITVQMAGFGGANNHFLMREQLHYLKNLLWSYGIDTRLLSAKYYPNAPIPWECGSLNACTLVYYYYTPKVLPYN